MSGGFSWWFTPPASLNKETMHDNTISQKIRTLRRGRHWSQKHMAGLLKISIPAYSKIECASTEVSVSRLKLLAGIFEVKASWLLDEEEAIVNKENEALKEKLSTSNKEIMALQKKLIKCFEEGQNNSMQGAEDFITIFNNDNYDKQNIKIN